MEQISDEGIDEADSDSSTNPTDYFLSSASRADLDIMSM